MWWGELPQALFQGFLCHRNVCAQLGWLQLSFRNPTQCLWGRQPIIENTFDCHDRLYGKSFASFHIKKYTKWIEYIPYHGVSLVAQLVKDMPAMQETEGLDPWVGKIPWRRAWQPTLVFLPGVPPDRGAWWATVQGSQKSRTRLKQLHTHAQLDSHYFKMFSFQLTSKLQTVGKQHLLYMYLAESLKQIKNS